MKKLGFMVLAMLLALTMLTGVLAEAAADVVGVWSANLLGIGMTLTLNEDGTYTIDMGLMGSGDGVWEMQEDGNILMDKGTDEETVAEVTADGISIDAGGMMLVFTPGGEAAEQTNVSLDIRTDATLDELQGEWVAKQAATMGLVMDADLIGFTCSMAVIDTALQIHEMQGDTSLDTFPIPMTFADGALHLELPDDEAPQVWTVGLLADGRLSFYMNVGGTEVTLLMEKVLETAE